MVFEVASRKDPIIQQVRTAIQDGDKNQVAAEYKHLSHDLSILGFVVLRACCVLIPSGLRPLVPTLAPEGIKALPNTKNY